MERQNTAFTELVQTAMQGKQVVVALEADGTFQRFHDALLLLFGLDLLRFLVVQNVFADALAGMIKFATHHALDVDHLCGDHRRAN